MTKVFMLLFAFLISGCTKDSFPKYIELNDLRIIALQTATPEVNPGDAVTVTPYVSDINNTAPLNYVAFGCVDPGTSNGADPSCDGNPTSTSLGTGTVTLTANTYTGSAPALGVITIPPTILTGRSAIDQHNGVAYLVTYQIGNAAGKTVKSFRRIWVSNRPAKNTNPAITDVLSDGATLGVLAPGVDYLMSMVFPAGAFETYDRMRSDGALVSTTEEFLTTWFISDGSMKYYRTGTNDLNTFTSPNPYPTARESFILVVVRDGRGGLNLVKRTIH